MQVLLTNIFEKFLEICDNLKNIFFDFILRMLFYKEEGRIWEGFS